MNKPVVEFELSAEVVDRLEREAMARGMSTQDLMNVALTEYLNRHGPPLFANTIVIECPSCGQFAPQPGQCPECGHVEGDKSSESE